MKILVADDDDVSRLKLETLLTRAGHEVVAVADGGQAWEILQRAEAPSLAILDWMMPGMDGIELCRRIRAQARPQQAHVILLTARQDRPSIIAGLQAGADDYVCKPFDPDELRARIDVGIRILGLQRSLAERVRELEDALAHIKQLQGILPICSYCKKVRNDLNYWQQVETYIGEHSDARFSHCICPECLPKVMADARQELGVSGPLRVTEPRPSGSG